MARVPPDFVAIDFETANASADSACAVGLVRVERGRVVRRLVRRIRPPTRRFEFTYVHGLTWNDVADAPTFAELWPAISRMCEGVSFLAAHNAEFDRGVLDACCSAARVRPPRLPFRCTLDMARRVLGMRPAGLARVADRLGIPLRHHDAGSDAEACARIVLHAWR